MAAAPLLAQAPIPRYEVKRATIGITVDGELDEPAWTSASAPLTLQFLWENETGTRQKTFARVV